SQVENFIAKKVDLILLCSADNETLKAAVPLCNKAKIPLITFSNTVGSDAHGKYEGVIAYIGRDEVKGGEMLGQMGEQLLQDRAANIVLIQGSPGTSAQRFRERGFLNIAKKHPNWQIVADRPITGWTKEGALSAMEDFLQTGKKVDLVVTQWWTAGIAAAMALKEKGIKDAYVVSLEYTKELIPYIKAGEVDITTYFSIVEEGYKAAEAAGKYLKGEKIQEFVEILPVWVTAENVDQFEAEM
ncbi:MAG: sugar ABC transporter substrate-binding protein, partial [Spirochaetota bacterium]